MIASVLIFLFFIGFLFVLIVGAITLQLIRMLSGEAPFISTEKCVRQEIVNILPLRKKSIVYDLGCGDAKVLIACHRKEPTARYIGVEKNIIPYCLARWNLFRYGHSKNIILLKKNLFSISYTDADVLYAYLFPDVLDKLLPKLEQELRPEATVITPTFRFSGKNPSRTVFLNHTRIPKTLIRKIFLTVF